MSTLTNTVFRFFSSAREVFDDAPSTSEGIVHDAFNRSLTFTPDDEAEPWSKYFGAELTIGGGGTYDLDLTALVDTENLTIDTAALRPRAIRLFTPDTNAAAIILATGIANGYTPFNGGYNLPVDVNAAVQWKFGGTLAFPTASSKLIRFSGTAADTIEIELWFGPDPA